MAVLIVLAVLVLFVVVVAYMFIYVNTPNQFDSNSVFGRMENRFKREQEQLLYEKIVMPVLGGIGLLILLAIGGCVMWITGNL